MAGLIRYSTSTRGKPVVIDKYHHRYTLNNFSTTQNYWRCAIRSCSARLTTRISRKDLCSSDLPEHSHGNQLLKKMAKKHEQEIIKEMSKPFSSTTTKAVLQEISQNIMGSATTGLMSSVSSAGSIKMSFWREKQKIHPRPSIPKDHLDWMSCEVPAKYSRTADVAEFLLNRAWITVEETSSLTVFLSD